MSSILTVLKKYQNVRSNVDAIAEKSIEDTKEQLLDFNTEQLFKGLTSMEGNFQQYASPIYADLKASRNPLPGYGNPDLFLTGAFYRGFQAEVSGGLIKIYSTDAKAESLEKKYGKDYIYGLSEGYRQEYINEVLRKAFFRNIKKQLQSA